MVGDTLHEVLFLQAVLVPDIVVEGQSDNQRKNLKVLRGFLEGAQHNFEEGSFFLDHCNLEFDYFFGLFEINWFL